MKRRSKLSYFLSFMLFITLIACISTLASAKQYTTDIEDEAIIRCTTDDTVLVQIESSYDTCRWSWNDDDDAASIDDDRDYEVLVEPYRTGTVTVKARVDWYGDKKYESYECEIIISSSDSDDDYFEFSKSAYDVDAGGSIKLGYDYGPSGSSSGLEFSSSDTSIATVSSTGKVTGKRAGTVTITGWYGNAKDTCKVYVDDDTGTLSLSPSSVTLEVGDEKHIKVDSWYDDELRWTSSNEKVATVDSDGYVTAKKEGTATITAEVRGDSSDYGTCKVTVKRNYTGRIDYAVATNGRLNFDLGKFNTFSQNLCSSDIDCIRFTTLPSTTRGTLYYRYDSTNDKKTVSTKETYYASGSNSISDLTFIPQLNYTGRVEYEFTAESKNGRSLSGTVRIDVSTPKEAATIIYTTTGTLPARFKFADFEKACSARNGGPLSSVRFTLPSSSVGMLYYNYLSPLRYTAVSSNGDYGLTGNLIDGVSFVPAAGSSGRVSIQYTGTDKNGAAYNGTVEIAVSNPMSNISKFNDVRQTDYFAQPVSWAIEKGITKGTSGTTFSPDATCTRVQILTFLWRAYGSPAPTITNPFSDLPNNKDYQSASMWAFQKNLISSTKLNPDAPCTRSEVARYLWILAGRPAAPTTQFADVPANSNYAQAVSWAYTQGVTDGTSASTFTPSATCTRGQIVTFLWRYVGHQVL